MSHEVAVISNVHLLEGAEAQINELVGHPIHFPKEDTQPSVDELIGRTGTADAVLVSPGTVVSSDYLRACPNVKYIGLCGTSKENVDLTAVEAHGIALTNVVDYGDEPTAEFIFMQLVSLARGINKYQWRDDPVELMGKSLGIIGLGALGQAVANLGLAYKMDVSYFSRSRKPVFEQQGIEYREKGNLLAESDIIAVTSATNTIVINQDDFSCIKPNTILLQASIGNCIDRAGFKDWITQEGNFAIFDYAAGENNYQAYKDLPRVVFPKIVAGHSIETRQRLGERVIANLKSFFEGI